MTKYTICLWPLEQEQVFSDVTVCAFQNCYKSLLKNKSVLWYGNTTAKVWVGLGTKTTWLGLGQDHGLG